MLDAASLGQMGSVIAVTGETIPASQYIGFLCVTDVELGNFKGHLKSIDGSPVALLTGVVFPAGMYVPVPFSSATMTSGILIAVKSGGLQ